MSRDNRDADDTDRDELIQINLFTTTLEPLGEYRAPTAPRVDEWVLWDDTSYQVEFVLWEPSPDSAEVQVRVEVRE